MNNQKYPWRFPWIAPSIEEILTVLVSIISFYLFYEKEILLRNTISIPQGSRPTKLEKADILEMTVRYIETLHAKLSIPPSRKMPQNLTESFGNVQWMKERAFSDITNQAIKNRQQQKYSAFDKENMSKNQSLYEESHWRPW